MLSYSGTIVADNRVALSFQVPGQITKVYVEEGQHVASDQLLAEATLEQVKDNFSRLKACMKVAKVTFFQGLKLSSVTVFHCWGQHWVAITRTYLKNQARLTISLQLIAIAWWFTS